MKHMWANSNTFSHPNTFKLSLKPCAAHPRLGPWGLIPQVSVAPLRQPCWPGKHCPLVGLVLTGLLPVSGSQFLLEEWVMRAGSSNECARDYLTKSSRLVDFCSSSNSFNGLNSSMGLSSPCTHRCVDHSTDLCLIRSPTCSFGPL